MRYFLDTEFDGHNGPLLSIALVREDGWSVHYETTAEAADPWVTENVLPLMADHAADVSGVMDYTNIGEALRVFIDPDQHPTIIADSPVDIGRFCSVISTGTAGGWVSADYPQMSFEVHNVDCYPTDLPGAVQHNAWWDAMALRHRLAQPEENAG